MNDLPAYYETSNSLVSAVSWIEGLLLGQLGTTIAVVAVAFAGMRMLSGRLAYRDGLRILFGCFIIFGAPVIAHGLADLAGDSQEAVFISTAALPLPQAPDSGHPPSGNVNPFDPYVGASKTP